MSKRTSLLYASLALTIILTVLQVLAIIFYFFWTYWWYDYMMHFLAGLTGGLATYWVLFDSGLFWKSSKRILVPILAVLVCLMIVGVAWEIAEYVYDITDSHEGLSLDISHDLIMDALGAITATLIGIRATYLRHG